MKRTIILMVFLLFCFSFSASADSPDTDSFYSEQYYSSGADGLYSALPEETQDFLNRNGISAQNPDFVNSLTAENVFSHIWSFIKSGAKTPIVTGTAVLAVILLSAAISSNAPGSAAMTAKYATVISAAAVIAAPVYSVITSGIKAMQGSSVFMTAFVPVFAVVTAAAGKAATSASMSALLLGASQAVSFISNFIVLPLMGGYLSLNISSAVSPLIKGTGIADGIKKIALWTMSLTSTLFIGILGIQTAVNSAADSLSLKTAKFIVGSSVPVAGTALSEALSTVTASLGLLKAGIGIWGVIACAAIFLPLLAELILWRIMLHITSAVADLFSISEISVILRSIDNVMSVLSGIILLIGAVFIISLTVVVGAAK